MRRPIKPTVLRVLSNDPASRDDDNRLIYAVCHEMGYKLLPEQVDLLNQLPNFKSIARARAKIQEQGRFLPSERVRRERTRHRGSKPTGSKGQAQGEHGDDS